MRNYDSLRQAAAPVVGGYLIMETNGDTQTVHGFHKRHDRAVDEGFKVERFVQAVRRNFGLVEVFPVTSNLAAEIEATPENERFAPTHFVMIGKERVLATKNEGQEAARKIAVRRGAAVKRLAHVTL